ncbi:MAG: M48 family metallopeptidase, partial [Flavobacteriales bacterium]|nr:M48 family metallopeptidase [Flavobacteriales bacterium]
MLIRNSLFFQLFVCGSLLLFLSFGIANLSSAQSFDALQSRGDPPKDLTMSPMSRTVKQLKEINWDDYDVSQKDAIHKFININSYAINSLLLSPSALYGGPLSAYVNKVAQELLRGSPDLKSKLTFYVYRSEQVNAISTFSGVIFINIGLIAHVKTEGELAFVLAHEIAHYVKQHTLHSYLKKQELQDQLESYDVEGIKSLYDHSQKHELEADEYGLVLLRKSKYHSEKAVTSALATLEYSDMSFIQKRFDATLFNSK